MHSLSGCTLLTRVEVPYRCAMCREKERLWVFIYAELNEFRVNGHNRTCEEQLRLLCRVRFLQHESRGFD
jgi:hypothetical protein